MITTDASKSGWEAFCNGVSTGGKWLEKEENLHINVLELIAAKFAILTITKGQSNMATHLQIDKETAPSYLLKIGGTDDRELLHISKSIWSYLLSKQIAMPAEYRITKCQGQFRMETRCFIFPRDCNTHGTTNSGSVCIQILSSTSSIHCMETRLGQYSNRCIPVSLGQAVRFCFSSIQFDKSGSTEDSRRKNRSSNHSDTTWQTKPWYDQLLKMPVQPPFLLPQVTNLLKNQQSKKHPLAETGSLRLAVWKVSGKVCKWKKFQAMLPNLSHIQGEKAQQLITNRPGVSGLAGIMKDKLIHFKHL